MGTEGNHGLPCTAVNGNLGIFQGNVHSLRTREGTTMAAAPHFPGGGVHAKGQAGEVAEWREGVGRGRGAVGTTQRPGTLAHPLESWTWTRTDVTARLRQVARGCLVRPASQEGQRGAGLGLVRLSPCFSWMWPLPLTCAILLLSMGPGGSGTDRAQAQCLWSSAATGRKPSPLLRHSLPPLNRYEPFSKYATDTCDPGEAVPGPRGQREAPTGRGA